MCGASSTTHKPQAGRRSPGRVCGAARDAALCELMEAKNRAFVKSQWLLYPCNSISGVVQVYPGDDERDSDAELLERPGG